MRSSHIIPKQNKISDKSIIFANLLMDDPSEDSWVIISAFIFNLFCFLVEIHEENLASHKHTDERIF